MAERCVFCEIVDGSRNALVVLDEPHLLGFLDQRPLFHGHVLVVPKVHHETLRDLPPAQLGSLFEAVQRVVTAVEETLAADGSFVAVNNRVSQSVPHLHVHVVPRRRRDGLKGFFWPRQPYRDESEAEAIRARLQAALKR